MPLLSEIFEVLEKRGSEYVCLKVLNEKISDEEIRILAGKLKKKKTYVTQLNFEGCEISESGARILLEVLDINKVVLFQMSPSFFININTWKLIHYKLKGRPPSYPSYPEKTLKSLVDIESWERFNVPFLKAAGNCDLEEVEKLLDAGADINAQATCGTALHRACLKLDHPILGKKALAVINLLLKKGANPDILCSYGRTPLYLAIIGNRNVPLPPEKITAIRALLAAGACPNILGPGGTTPLWAATERGDLAVGLVRILLEAKADYSITNINGITLLTLSVSRPCRTTEMARLFLEAGANYEDKDQHGRSPIDYCILDGRKDFAEFLVREGNKIRALRAAASATYTVSEGKKVETKTAVPEREDPVTAFVATVRAFPHTSASVTTPENAEEAKTLRLHISSVDRRLGIMERAVQYLNPSVLAKLNASEEALDCMIENALKEVVGDNEHKRVFSEEHLTAYYCMFLVLLEGSWRACENIYSGFVGLDKKGAVDHTTQALDEAVKLFPGLGIPLQIISTVIKAVDLPDKKRAVYNIAFFFSHERELPEIIIRTLARRLAIAQEASLRVLFSRSPVGFNEKLKQGYRELKNFILSDQCQNLVMAEARTGIGKLLAAISKGELTPAVNPDKVVQCVLGADVVVVSELTTAPSLQLTASQQPAVSMLKSAPDVKTHALELRVQQLDQQVEQLSTSSTGVSKEQLDRIKKNTEALQHEISRLQHLPHEISEVKRQIDGLGAGQSGGDQLLGTHGQFNGGQMVVVEAELQQHFGYISKLGTEVEQHKESVQRLNDQIYKLLATLAGIEKRQRDQTSIEALCRQLDQQNERMKKQQEELDALKQRIVHQKQNKCVIL